VPLVVGLGAGILAGCKREVRTATCWELPEGRVGCGDDVRVEPTQLRLRGQFVEAVAYRVALACTLTERGEVRDCQWGVGPEVLKGPIVAFAEGLRYQPMSSGKSARARISLRVTIGHSRAFDEVVSAVEGALFTVLADSAVKAQRPGETVVGLCLALGEGFVAPRALSSLVPGARLPRVASVDQCAEASDRNLGRGYITLHISDILWLRPDVARATTHFVVHPWVRDSTYELVRGQSGWVATETEGSDAVE